MESLGEIMFVMAHVELRQVHTASDENGVKAKVKYFPPRQSKCNVGRTDQMVTQ